ncbi:cyclase family protein [Prosthecomicrobium hirschii]|uniref:Cyclase n=1 Tax=Prosthecodimorpha hirschii TaxID=665126 RepID=A0A0N8GFP6_9HYPH|nr:cyclase family protein [Prosthecomicrobium hirschii]KPL54905.1 cyclase [Prosthecomicrobium hirschii]MCW1840186.1 cyclase family protein [Prosthecomicrobium hirschii]TPQ44575.1 cyclase [Prosthecomicrobium hirschii]
MCVPGCEEAVLKRLSRRGLFKGFGAVTAAGFAATAVPGVAAAQAPARSFSKVVDLTHTMSPDFPTFFGVPGIEMQKQFDFKKDGFNLYWWRIIEHAGTHMDAPIHFSEAGATIDKIAADQLVAPLAVIDISAKAAADVDALVTVADIEAWEKAHGKLPDNCVVAMNSGWDKHVTTPKFMGKDAGGVLHFPGFSAEAAEFLIKNRTVRGMAVDSASLDHGPSKDFKVHYMWLPSGRFGLECVANLGAVPPVGATIVVGQPKVKDATGGPSRILALV